MSKPFPEVFAKYIGWSVTAKAVPTAPAITILSEDGIDEGAYFPAQSILVTGIKSLTVLRDLCDEVLRQHAEYNEPEEKPIR